MFKIRCLTSFGVSGYVDLLKHFTGWIGILRIGLIFQGTAAFLKVECFQGLDRWFSKDINNWILFVFLWNGMLVLKDRIVWFFSEFIFLYSLPI